MRASAHLRTVGVPREEHSGEALKAPSVVPVRSLDDPSSAHAFAVSEAAVLTQAFKRPTADNTVTFDSYPRDVLAINGEPEYFR